MIERRQGERRRPPLNRMQFGKASRLRLVDRRQQDRRSASSQGEK